MSQADDAAHALARLWAESERIQYQLGLAIRDAQEALEALATEQDERISR